MEDVKGRELEGVQGVREDVVRGSRKSRVNRGGELLECGGREVWGSKV